jgi:hypothetical protein
VVSNDVSNVSNVSNISIDKDNIALVLYTIIKNKVNIKNRIIDVKGNYFVANPMKFKSAVKKQSPVKKQSQVKKQSNLKQSVKKLDADIYGSFIDNKFKIIFKKEEGKDLRTVTNGKECTSFSKGELMNVAMKFGINTNTIKPSKEKLCKLIFNYFKEHNLLAN